MLLDLLTVKFLGSYQTRPMHVFGSLGLGCLGLGFASVLTAGVMKYTTGPGMTANPLFLIGADKQVQLVNYRYLGGYYIVDRLIDVAELRLGEKNQTVVRITRTRDRG